MIEGKTIAITRSKEDAQEFIELITNEGAKPLPLPTIQLVSKGEKIVTEFIQSIQDFSPDYSIFMSAKAVKLLFEEAQKISLYEKLQLAVANTIVIAVGPKTKISLEKEGIKVAYMPTRYSSVGVGEVLSKLDAVGKKAIIPRSGASTQFLHDLLEKIGLQVHEIHLYDVCAFNDTTQWNEFRELFSKSNIDGIIFTSVSSVRAFFEIMRKDYDEKTLRDKLKQTKVVSIGPFTATELEQFHVNNVVSQTHTVPGAFETIKTSFS